MHLSTAQNFMIESLSALMPLSEELKVALREKFVYKRVGKGQRIKQEAHTDRHLRLLVRGLVKAAYDTDGKEHILWFGQEGHFVLLPDSFFPQVPTEEYVETIEECQFFQLSFEDLESLFTLFPDMERLARFALQQHLVDAGRRARMLRLSSPQSRYHHFMTVNAQLSARLKRADIASYLNISPGTLSRPTMESVAYSRAFTSLPD